MKKTRKLKEILDIMMLEEVVFTHSSSPSPFHIIRNFLGGWRSHDRHYDDPNPGDSLRIDRLRWFYNNNDPQINAKVHKLCMRNKDSLLVSGERGSRTRIAATVINLIAENNPPTQYGIWNIPDIGIVSKTKRQGEELVDMIIKTANKDFMPKKRGLAGAVLVSDVGLALEWPNGVMGIVFWGDDPETLVNDLSGHRFSYLWFDGISTVPKIWENLSKKIDNDYGVNKILISADTQLGKHYLKKAYWEKLGKTDEEDMSHVQDLCQSFDEPEQVKETEQILENHGH